MYFGYLYKMKMRMVLSIRWYVNLNKYSLLVNYLQTEKETKNYLFIPAIQNKTYFNSE